MLAPITIRYGVSAKRPSLMAAEVCDTFGLRADEPPLTVCENLVLDVQPHELVLFTGPSGSGKSSILRAVAAQLHAVDATALLLPDAPLAEALPGTVQERLSTLAACGLGEARLMLRTPGELSDGQLARYRLAYALATTAAPLACDEFTALLDRPLAKVLAFGVRKLVSRTQRGLLVATAHEDIAEDLQPDVHIRCAGDGGISVSRADAKKKRSPLAETSGCRPVPTPTGRISLGGITAATTSAS